MTIYVLIWLFLFSLSNIRVPRYLKNGLLLLIFCVLVFVAGFRTDDTGIDTSTYHEIYNAISKSGYLFYLEPGWNVINTVAYRIGLSFNGFLLLVSALTLLPIFYVSNKLLKNPFWGLFIYFSLHMFGASLNVMRQYLALSYILLGYYYYFREYKKSGLLMLLIAISIHYSSIFAIVIVPFINKIKISSNTVVLILILLSSVIIGILMPAESLLKNSIIYDSYVDSELLYRKDYGSAVIMALLLSAFTAFCFWNLPCRIKNIAWSKLIIIYAIYVGLTCKILLAARIGVIFGISQLIFYPMFLRDNKIGNGIAKLVINLYLAIDFFRILFANGNGICPYENIIFP